MFDCGLPVDHSKNLVEGKTGAKSDSGGVQFPSLPMSGETNPLRGGTYMLGGQVSIINRIFPHFHRAFSHKMGVFQFACMGRVESAVKLLIDLS